MKLSQDAQMLRIFIVEDDKYQGQPLYEAIVNAALDFGLAGATVLRGIIGYGSHTVIHTTKVLRLSDNLPLVVEIVDDSEKIESFLPLLEQMISEGLVTMEKVRVISYGNESNNN